MKKRLMIIGVIMLLILTSTLVSYAADTGATVSLHPDKSEVKVGETFTVTLNATCTEGITGIDTTYTYDTEKLELENAAVIADSKLVSINLPNEIEGKISVIGATSEQSVDVYKLTFKVKEGVAANSTAIISLGETYLGAMNSNAEYTLQGQSITVTVIEETTPPGGDGENECQHTYEIQNSNIEHWEVCTKCDEVKSGSKEEHKYSYVDNKNGTHTGTCTVCDYKKTEEHDFNSGICNECKAVEATDDECEHTYEKGSSETQHWEACSKCGQIKSGTLKTHTYDSYKNNNDGTHTATCTECGHEHKEAHATNVACDKCGYKPATNNNNGGNSNGGTSNGDNNNEANKDNTVADKEIPKAGLNIMLVFGIISIVAVAVIMYNKNQKYKDIK